MARYWVGGSGTWDSTSTTNWSATSGGTGGASVPTSSDFVYFNSSSGGGTVTLSGSLSALALEVSTGYTGMLDFGSSTLRTYNTVSGFLVDASGCTLALGTSTITVDGERVIINSACTVTGSGSFVLTNANVGFAGGGKSYGAVTYTNTALDQPFISGANTIGTLTITGRTTRGLASFLVSDDQTITTLNITNGSVVPCRVMLWGFPFGTAKTLTVTSCTNAGYTDFRDITIAGAAAPITGTYVGDCGGNSGITFPSPKTSYFVGTTNNIWTTNAWSNTNGGSGNDIYFPLAQDTATFTDTSPASSNYVEMYASGQATDPNIGTIDASTRTRAIGLSFFGSFALYGSYYGGVNTSAAVIYAKPRTGQTVSSGTGSSYITNLYVQTYGSGTLTLSGNYAGNTIYFYQGTLIGGSGTISILTLDASDVTTRHWNVGSALWQIGNTFSYYASNFTVSGTGTISMTSASTKTFAGNDIQTWPTLDQGGAGTLIVTGNNKFRGLTNSYGTTAATTIQFAGGSTNEFDAVSVYGSVGKLCTITSTNTTKVTLKKGSVWFVGTDSVIASTASGFLKTAGDGNYLSISYAIAAPFAGGDMMLMFGY